MKELSTDFLFLVVYSYSSACDNVLFKLLIYIDIAAIA